MRSDRRTERLTAGLKVIVISNKALKINQMVDVTELDSNNIFDKVYSSPSMNIRAGNCVMYHGRSSS